MIASRIGLAIATGIALVLALVLVLDLRRDGSIPDRALVPGFDAARVASLTWDGGALGPVRIERDAAMPSGWRWADPAGQGDRQTIEDLFAAARGARWHRRADVAAAGTIQRTLVLEGGGNITTFGLGAELGEQRWVVVDGERAVLVDRWVTGALAPDPVALRVHRPFSGIANASRIEIGNFELAGTPRRIVKLASMPVELLAKSAAIDELERVLGEVVVVAVAHGKVPVDTSFRGTRFAFDGTLIAVEMGRCPDLDPAHHAFVGPAIGSNCVAETAWKSMLAALSTFEVGGETGGRLKRLVELAEPRPVPIGQIEPIGVTLADGSLLDLAKRPRVKDPKQPSARDADPARVAELLAALATPGKPIALPAAAPVGHLEVVAGHDTHFALDLFPGAVVARHGEPIALDIGDAAYAMLTRPGAAYGEPTLWTEEPLTIHTMRIGAAAFTRSAVVGEWTRDGKPAPADLAKTFDQLAQLLASPRALGPALAGGAQRQAIVLEIQPPAGPASKHALAIGREANVCVAVVESANHAIEPQICDLLDAIK